MGIEQGLLTNVIFSALGRAMVVLFVSNGVPEV
jgi:hypothetical protein